MPAFLLAWVDDAATTLTEPTPLLLNAAPEQEKEGFKRGLKGRQREVTFFLMELSPSFSLVLSLHPAAAASKHITQTDQGTTACKSRQRHWCAEGDKCRGKTD